MSSIVKTNRSAETAHTPSDCLSEPPSVRPDTGSGRRTASARIIKTTPAGEQPDSSDRSTDDSIADSRRVDGRPGGQAETRSRSKRLDGATIGKHQAGRTGLIEFNFSDLAEQGREQIQRCRQQVASMLEEARAEAEQIKQNAITEGNAIGKRAAEKEIEQRIGQAAEAQAKAKVASLQQAAEQMKVQYDAWMQQYADVLTATAIAVAERLTRAQLRLPGNDGEDAGNLVSDTIPAANAKSGDPQEHLIVRWAREALHSTRSASRLTLVVHPEVLARLGKSLDGLLAHPDLPEQSVVIPDETLAPGEIILRQDGGEISAGLDAQLHRLREELM